MSNTKHTDRWTIGSPSLEMYLSESLGWVTDEKNATIYPSSFAASEKMHQLIEIEDLEVVALDPSATFKQMIAFNEY